MELYTSIEKDIIDNQKTVDNWTKLYTILEDTAVILHDESSNNQTTIKPIFLPSVTNITIKLGALAVLPCSIQNLQDKQVAWRYVDEDKFLTIGKTTWLKSSDILIEHLSQANNISNWDLLIKNAQFKNGGVYECQITSTVDLTRRVQLSILETSISGERTVDRGDKIYIKCNVTGKPHIPTDIQWYKDGHSITSEDFPNVIITKYVSKLDKLSTFISEIIIDKSVFSDTGIYTCRSLSVDAVKEKFRLQIGDTVHVKRMFEDLKKERRKHSTPLYKSGSLQKNSSSKQSVLVLQSVTVMLIWVLWNR
ncbi:hypothetical protein LOTGIDRAFT_166439 [Lottia gigantea]|uniref:Ig-like domain-containing protein n=1 Tax=Lottia gigantea TaxID=225164 RepID=V4BF86_LOTGI|nr:hypothetical protein LOTGIDRAFT_166439 [Lottia gigantea]ESO87559.1 hypothetical protein LOTGIDRAFT_166439 [Lottia gigantea]